MNLIIRLILIDERTGRSWETPDHNDNPKFDDFHRVIKQKIIADLPRKLKGQFGKNFDIRISDGYIVVKSQIIDSNSGRRVRKFIKTDIRANDYFEEMSYLLTHYILSKLSFCNYKIILERTDKIASTIYFEIRILLEINY